MRIAINYIIFAVVAIVANIATQELSLFLYAGNWAIFVAIGFGTISGLVVKYELDKRFIYYFRTTSILHNGRLFFLYSTTGLITTMIFWFFEYGFYVLFSTKFMTYTGAIIGLSIGYIMKYHLDKKFVFPESA